ncbi:MAG: hypothetical protein A2W33_06720 [Chloroflexi bacterium RBG_16_52_11]|nr:MAG: hypothetical protein A2W33_06720 [Chloroflexi bacterium RBG_16_52_11]
MARRGIYQNLNIWGKANRPLRWLIPGLGVKRWLIPILLGMTLLAVGLTFFLLDIYRNAPQVQWYLDILSTAALRFLPRQLRVVIFGGLGIGLVVIGIWGMNRALIAPFIRPGRPVVDAISEHRKRERGPRVVVIGGGNGLSTLLRGLKEYTYGITAIVTVADDGGSSGRIRRETGILPPGDIRSCLAALSSNEALLSQLFQYRFADGQSGLEGHSFGNLFITALAEITGSFEEAVAESGRVLAVNGRVLPSTLHDVQLVADIQLPYLINEVRVEGESQIPEAAGRVRRVWLEPNSPPAFPHALRAILSSDLIVVGPGSLYTSILPNLLVPDISEAIRSSRALKLYVCNVATQPGETDGYSCGDHVRAIEDHVGGGIFDIIIANKQCIGSLPGNSQWVLAEDELDEDYAVHRANLADDTHPWRHDTMKLSQEIMDLFEERTGPLLE